MFDPCVSCHSTKIEEVIYDGYFEFEGKRYDLKTKYSKCQKCKTEFISRRQIKENQEYLYSVKLTEENLLLN